MALTKIKLLGNADLPARFDTAPALPKHPVNMAQFGDDFHGSMSLRTRAQFYRFEEKKWTAPRSRTRFTAPSAALRSSGYSYATHSSLVHERHRCPRKSLKTCAVSLDSILGAAGIGGSNLLTPTN